ncbi:MAG TPA: hypothetical protein VL285_08175 [Bryobacteraceae bacterium]|jgi:hypothetical protein|nr:hypothetical protein [Bryobacteraceae bacterium]
MAHELFSNILEATRDTFRHLANASFETLAMMAGVLALLGYLLFKR